MISSRSPTEAIHAIFSLVLPRSHAPKSRTASADSACAPARPLPATLFRRARRLQRAAVRSSPISAASAAGLPMLDRRAFSANHRLGIFLPDTFLDFLAVLRFWFCAWTISCPNSLQMIVHPNCVWRPIFSPMILPCPSRDNGNREQRVPSGVAPLRRRDQSRKAHGKGR